MAFAGIFQSFARLRWIRFGLLMRDPKFSRRFSVPQTPQFKFTEAVSFVINCDTQEEIDPAAAGLGETHRWRRGGTGMRMGRGQVRTLLAGNTGKLFYRMGEGCGRSATGDARGVADEEARSRKAREGICGEVRTAPAIHFATARGRSRRQSARNV